MTTIKNDADEYTITVDSTGADIHWQGQTLTVEPEDLIAGGWEFEPECGRDHCADGECEPCSACEDRYSGDDGDLRQSVEQWHNSEHKGVLRFCDHEVCIAMGRVMGVRHG